MSRNCLQSILICVNMKLIKGEKNFFKDKCQRMSKVIKWQRFQII